MDTQFSARENAVEILRNKFFRTEPKSNQCWSLIGSEKSGKTGLLQKLAEEYGKKAHPRVFYVFYSVSNVKEMEGVTSPYTLLWANVVSAIADEVTVEKLRAAMTLSEERGKRMLVEVQSIYDMMKKAESLTVLNVGKKVRRLFELYTKLGVQILLVLDEVDAIDSLFPYDAEKDDDSGRHYLFNDLFSLSGKGGKGLSLSILLMSRCRIGMLQHKVDIGSNVEQAYSIIRI